MALRQTFGRDCRAPGNAASKTWLVRTEESRANGRMNAVTADHDVGIEHGADFGAGGNGNVVLVQVYYFLVKVDRDIRRFFHRLGENAVKISTM